MLVTLYPGAARNDVLRTLREIESAAHSAARTTTVGSHGSKAYRRLTSSLQWAANSVRMPEHRVSAVDIDRLVLTCGYERLMSAGESLSEADTGTQRVVNGLAGLEIRQRTEGLQEAIKDLDEQIRGWPKDTTYTVADTSVSIEHDDKLRDLDFTARLDGRPDKPVVVIVPLIILDELDGLQHPGGDAMHKWRASCTLSVLEDVFSRSATRGVLRKAAADGTRGAVYADIPIVRATSDCRSTTTRSSTARWPPKALRMPASLC